MNALVHIALFSPMLLLGLFMACAAHSEFAAEARSRRRGLARISARAFLKPSIDADGLDPGAAAALLVLESEPLYSTSLNSAPLYSAAMATWDRGAVSS